MFGFHEHGAETGDGNLLAGLREILPGILWKKRYRKLGQGQVEVMSGGFVEDALGEGGRSFRSRSADGPEDDVELWRS